MGNSFHFIYKCFLFLFYLLYEPWTLKLNFMFLVGQWPDYLIFIQAAII